MCNNFIKLYKKARLLESVHEFVASVARARLHLGVQRRHRLLALGEGRPGGATALQQRVDRGRQCGDDPSLIGQLLEQGLGGKIRQSGNDRNEATIYPSRAWAAKARSELPPLFPIHSQIPGVSFTKQLRKFLRQKCS